MGDVKLIDFFVKIIALMLSLILSLSTYACMVPNQGDEYDKLITAKQLDKPNSYWISLPRSLYDSKGWPQLNLTYYTHAFQKGSSEKVYLDGTQRICLPKDHYGHTINLKSPVGYALDYLTGERQYEGEIIIDPKDGYAVVLDVMWEHEVCKTVASKVILE